MEGCLLGIANNAILDLVNLVKNEAQHLCCFNSYVENFDQKKKILAAKHRDVKRKFQKGKGVFSFKFESQEWVDEADGIIDTDTKTKKRFLFGQCPNCWWQYRRGKELAKKTQQIEDLLGRCNFDIVAGRANVSNIKHLPSQDFIHFESRESKFHDLMETLQDKNCNMIGLVGMGGAGKTSMAKEVGQKLLESKLIDNLIFLVVSKPPDFKKIRGELAKGLDLNSKDVREEDLSDIIWSEITNMDEKLLIILDDVWEKFDLAENLGIPTEHRYKGYSLLITTRNSRVCTEMGCQTTELHELDDEEALSLFERHASTNNSSRGLKGMPRKIVKRCGGVPVAIVAIARALKNQPRSVWKDALKTLEDRGVDQNLEEAFKCLKLSYDNLKNQMAKELLLISSLFPDDSDIPIDLLIKIGIGLGSFKENGTYHSERSEVHGAITELIHYSLLLNGEEQCIKMHDLVREVTLWIGENDIQSIVDLEVPIKGKLRYLFWKNNYFPGKFDGNNLEVLSIWPCGSKEFNVSDTFFNEITSLKVLVLANDERIPALALANSLQPLKDIQTIALAYLDLGDVSVLGNLLGLRTLWFYNCSIIELPREFLKLKKLRSLDVQECQIEKNNPFEVIERCSQLEELTFIVNECGNEEKNVISQNACPLTLHRYLISSEDLSDYFEMYGPMSRCFQTDEFSRVFSDATFKQLVKRAELLVLEGEDVQRRWEDLRRNIVATDEGGMMNDLIVLHLSSYPEMECLIDTRVHDSGVTAFCNLAELHLFEVGIEDLCRGPLPPGFLEELEIMKLVDCPKLTSVFQPSTARSLMKLEKLTIRNCSALEYIVAGEDGDSNQKSYYNSVFPKLRIFEIAECNKIRIVLPILFAGGLASLEKISICESEQLEYIFDKFQEGEDAMLPSLKELELSRVPSFIGIVREHHPLINSSTQQPSAPLSTHNSNNINQSLASRAFSWVQACCSLSKSRATNKMANITVSEQRSLDHTNQQELDGSTDGVDPCHAAHSLLVQSLKNVRKIELVECGNLVSLSTLSNAASTISLEKLIVKECHKLKCITTHEGDAHQVDKHYCSIFPTLENLEIGNCKELEFVFQSSMSGGLQKLKSLTIWFVPELKYVVVNKYGREQHSSNHNQNDELHFDLPALETLSIENAPNMKSIICAKNYKMVLSSLQNVETWNCNIKSWSDYDMVNLTTTEEFCSSTDRVLPFHASQISVVQSLNNVRKIELCGCWNLISLSIVHIATPIILLEDLEIRDCQHLKCIVEDEGDAGTHMNYNSIFPKLKHLEVAYCNALEYLVPAYAFRCPTYLESLKIHGAPMLKYVFGRSQHEDNLTHQNQNNKTYIDFPALNDISFGDVPELVSIYPENYYLRKLSPKSSIRLVGYSTFTRPFKEFLLCWHVKQQETKEIEMCRETSKTLRVWWAKMKEIVDLTVVDIEKNGDGLEPLTSSLQMLDLRYLSKLVNICVGSKQIICFNNLQKLDIYECKKLKVIFSASIVRSLPMLKELNISCCEELVDIVEEDYETNDDDHLRHESCFSNLERIYVSECDKLKHLFSISISGILPKLRFLLVSEAYELEHVLARQCEMKDMVMKDVLPQLTLLRLWNLPNLVSLCHGIDFQILEGDKKTMVSECPNFSFYETSKLQAGPETTDSQVEEKAEQKHSSHLNTEQSLNMGEATQQSLTEKAPIHTSPNLNVLPIGDNTHASTTKIFEEEEEEEEEEEGSLITSRRPRSSMKVSGSLPEKKLENTIDDDPCVPPETIVLSEQTSEVILPMPLSPISSKASTSLNQTPPSIIPKHSDEYVKVYDKSHLYSSSSFEGIASGGNKEAGMVQNESKSNVEPSNPTQREQEYLSYSKGQIQTNNQLTDSQPRRTTPTTPFVTTSKDESSKIVEVRAEDGASILKTPHPSSLTSKKEPIPVSPNPTVLSTSPSTTVKIFKEEEKGGLICTHRHQSDMKVGSSLPVGKEQKTSDHGDPFVPSVPIISSEQQASEIILPSSPKPSKALMSPKQILMSTPSESSYGRNIQDNVETTDQHLHETLDAIQISSQLAECGSSNMDASIYDTNNNALSVPEVKEIADMMKLEDVEPSMLAEAFKTNPQLHFSSEDRSTELLCYSYRVLLNILNILATRSPITITEADKRLLAKHLKDASVLGFDKDWLESIRSKVFTCDTSELHRMQQALKGLGNKLQANKIELANVQNQEAKAAKLVETTQKELEATHKELEAAYKGLEAAQSHFTVALQGHANIRVRRSQLLEECQEISEQRYQCSEIIAAKFRPFGF